MSLGRRFTTIDATVTVPDAMPEDWHASVDEFYRNPNDEVWGSTLGRILMHESVHFWQLLSSAYVANLVQLEWVAMRRFEEGGDPRVPEPIRAAVDDSGSQPFSEKELMECWARYWDVHTRSPQQLLEEVGLDPAYHGPRPDHGAPVDPYSGEEFDAFMKRGPDAQLYARPYRWALDEVDNSSWFLNTIFPTLVFEAFGSPRPVAFFMQGLRRAVESADVARAVLSASVPPVVNIAWMRVRRVVSDHACRPTIRDLRLPTFTGGWDVLNRGRGLQDHPVYSRYGQKVTLLPSWLPSHQPAGSSITEQANSLCIDSAWDDPGVMFAFPGQPVFRHVLGRAVPPPRIVFRDGEWHAPRALDPLFADPADTFESAYSELDTRVTRFRQACYAVRTGLPADHFDQDA